MKVLFNTYPTAFHTPGGGEIQLLSYKKYLQKLDVSADLFNLWSPQFCYYDIVHFFSVYGGSIPFCEFVKKLKLPLVISSSLWATPETKHLYPWNEIQHQLSLADRIITNSNIESQQLSNLTHLPIDKFAVVYNGVDPLFFNPVSADIFRHHFNIEYPFILHVGNIEPRKNQLNLIKAIKEFSNLKLISIGHIRDQAYGEQCFDLGKDQFVFLGALDHDSELLRSAYVACDLFALPSTLETPGLAALEAAAMGAPILLTGVGSTQEYFGQYVSYVSDPLNVSEIAEKIGDRLNNRSDTSILSTKIKESFSWCVTVKQLREIYKAVLNS